MNEKKLIGKTITKAEIRKISDKFDDEPILFLEMKDGSQFEVKASYGGYTGNSEDEYPTFISVKEKWV